MTTRMKGYVRNWNVDGGWGFLRHERITHSISFGIKDLLSSAQSSLLRQGAKVEFVLEQGEERYEAKQVRVVSNEDFRESTFKRAPPQRDIYPPPKRKRMNEMRYVPQPVTNSKLRVKTNPESKKNSVFDLTLENNDYRRTVNRNNSNPSRNRRNQKKKRKAFKRGAEKSSVKVDAVDLCTPSPERPKSVSTQQRKSVSVERRGNKLVKDERTNSLSGQKKIAKIKQEEVLKPPVKSEKTSKSVKAEPTQNQQVKPEPTRPKFKLHQNTRKAPNSVKKETVEAQQLRKRRWRNKPGTIDLPITFKWDQFESNPSNDENFVQESSQVKKQIAQVQSAIAKEREKAHKSRKHPKYHQSDSSTKTFHEVPKAVAVPSSVRKASAIRVSHSAPLKKEAATPPLAKQVKSNTEMKKTGAIPISLFVPLKKEIATPPLTKQVNPEIEKGKSATPQPPASLAKVTNKPSSTTGEIGNTVIAFLNSLKTGDRIQFTWKKESKPRQRQVQFLKFYENRGLIYLEKRVEGDSVETLPVDDFQFVTDLSKSSTEPASIEIKQPSPSPKKRPTPPPKVKPKQIAKKDDRLKCRPLLPDKKLDWKEALQHPNTPPATPPEAKIVRPFAWLSASPEAPNTARKPKKVNTFTSWKDVSLSSGDDDDLSDEEIEPQRPSRKIVKTTKRKKRVTNKVPNFNPRTKQRIVPPPPPPKPPAPTFNSRKRPVQSLQELFDPHQKKKKRKVKRLEPEQKIEPANKLIDDHKQSGSVYKGVYYLPKSQTWRGAFEFEGRVEHIGQFCTEIQAAKAVNRRCQKHGLRPLNPTLYTAPKPKQAERQTFHKGRTWKNYRNNSIEPGKSLLYKIDGFSFLPDDIDPDSFTDSSSKEEYQYQDTSSQDKVKEENQDTFSRRKTKQSKKKYTGVVWNKKKQKWQVKRQFGGAAHYGGFWETAELAAHAADDLLITFATRVQSRWLNFPQNQIELERPGISSIYTKLQGNQAILRKDAKEKLRRRANRIHA